MITTDPVKAGEPLFFSYGAMHKLCTEPHKEMNIAGMKKFIEVETTNEAPNDQFEQNILPRKLLHCLSDRSQMRLLITDMREGTHLFKTLQDHPLAMPLQHAIPRVKLALISHFKDRLSSFTKEPLSKLEKSLETDITERTIERFGAYAAGNQ